MLNLSNASIVGAGLNQDPQSVFTLYKCFEVKKV